jgi:hypothetical protein
MNTTRISTERSNISDGHSYSLSLQISMVKLTCEAVPLSSSSSSCQFAELLKLCHKASSHDLPDSTVSITTEKLTESPVTTVSCPSGGSQTSFAYILFQQIERYGGYYGKFWRSGCFTPLRSCFTFDRDHGVETE